MLYHWEKKISLHSSGISHSLADICMTNMHDNDTFKDECSVGEEGTVKRLQVISKVSCTFCRWCYCCTHLLFYNVALTRFFFSLSLVYIYRKHQKSKVSYSFSHVSLGLSVMIYIKHEKVPMSCETSQPLLKLKPSFTGMPENTLHTHKHSHTSLLALFFFYNLHECEPWKCHIPNWVWISRGMWPTST